MKSDGINKSSEFDDVEFNEAQQLSEDVVNACAQPSGEPATEGDSVVLSKAEYDKLQQELSEAKDRGLRALAELENFRARTKRLQEEEHRYASADLARAILPVWDNLNLALNIDDPEHNGAAILDGVKMVADEFLSIFQKNGVEKIEALHQPFDPKYHESVAFMPSDEFPANTVLVEVKTGFKLHERVLRATQVVLAAPKSNAPKNEAQEA